MICLKKLVLMKPVNQFNVLYAVIITVNFRFQAKTCNGCHDLMQKAVSFNGVAIVSVKKIDIEFIFDI